MVDSSSLPNVGRTCSEVFRRQEASNILATVDHRDKTELYRDALPLGSVIERLRILTEGEGVGEMMTSESQVEPLLDLKEGESLKVNIQGKLKNSKIVLLDEMPV